MIESLPRRAIARTSVIATTAAAAGVLAAPAALADEHAAAQDRADAVGRDARLFGLVPDEDLHADPPSGEADDMHVVGRGESLADIAREYGIDHADGWRRLFDANPDIDDPNLIEPGEEIRIPDPDEELEPRELPTVTATAAPRADGGSGDAVSSTTAGGGVWDRLARCEAGGNWSANTGNGFHGGLQFHPQTWTAHGGHQYAPYAHQASRGEQIAIAERVLASQGWGAWPSCSRQLGLR